MFMKTILITISLLFAITSCAKKDSETKLSENNEGESKKFITSGYNGTILTSSDGTPWTSRTSGTSNHLWEITYANNTFVVVGQSGTILTSSDGTIWTSRTSGTSNSLYGITYGNSTFVAVGYSGTILTSSDGISWTSKTSGTSKGLYGITYVE